MVEIKGVQFNPEGVRKMSKSAFVKIVETMKDTVRKSEQYNTRRTLSKLKNIRTRK